MSSDNEIEYFNKMLELTGKADNLIEVYTETASIMNELLKEAPAEMLEQMQASFDLAVETVITLSELKTTLTVHVEHAAEINDKLTEALKNLEKL